MLYVAGKYAVVTVLSVVSRLYEAFMVISTEAMNVDVALWLL
jgi:hypothetical protein